MVVTVVLVVVVVVLGRQMANLAPVPHCWLVVVLLCFSGGCWLCGGPVAVGNGSVRGLCGSGSLSDEEEDEESEDEEDDDCAVLSGGRSPSGSSGARLAVLTGRS